MLPPKSCFLVLVTCELHADVCFMQKYWPGVEMLMNHKDKNETNLTQKYKTNMLSFIISELCGLFSSTSGC